MHILITGGTGLIGRKLCKALLTQGHELTVFSRKPATVAVKCGASVQAMSSFTEWDNRIAFDAVINLAGEPIVDARWTTHRKQVLWDSRITFTEDLVRHIAAARHKPNVLLSGSAIGYYGNRKDIELDESAEPGKDFPAQLCKAWENAAQPAEQSGVRVCLLRTGLVLSNTGGLLHRMLLPFKLGLGTRLGKGTQWMSWIHIDDYVEILIRLLNDAQASGPYNLTAPHPATNTEFVQTLAKVLNRFVLFAAPELILKSVLGERACLLVEGQKVLPVKILADGYRFKFDNLRDALGDLLS